MLKSKKIKETKREGQPKGQNDEFLMTHLN